MKHTPSRCPPPAQLEQFVDEVLTDPEQQTVAEHVGDCPSCQEALERLTDNGPASCGSMHTLYTPGTSDAPALADSSQTAFLAQLKLLYPFAGAAAADGHVGGPTLPSPAATMGAALSGSPTVPGFEILRELGRGGMGVVYKARQVSLNRLVALKMILAGRHAGQKDLARFRKEAEAVARLRHPNIVQIHEIGDADGRPYLALEFVEENLLRRLRGDPQPVAAAAGLVETLARAVHFAHAHQIVHRDLKPANILLRRKAEIPSSPSGAPSPSMDDSSGQWEIGIWDLEPKVTDFGLAKRLDEQSSGSPSGEVVGTPSYMAPEQASGKAALIGPATDVYALGAILYEMLTGRPPFKGGTAVDTLVQVLHKEPVRPGQLRPELPRDLETICLKCLEKDPARRYASAQALAEDLQRFRKGKPILARAVGPLERSWKWARRRPVTAALLLGIVLVTLLGFAGVTWQWRSAEGARGDAEVARGLAAQDRERARAALYYSLIAQGQLQWRVNDFLSAERSLAQCVPESGRPDPRGWEWHYLKGLFQSDLFTLDLDRRGPGTGLVYDPEGRWLAAVVGGQPEEEGKAGEVRTWDAATGELLHARPCPSAVHRLAVRPDGQRLALAATDGTVLVWDAAGKELLRRKHHTDLVACIAFSPDGKRLASASWDKTVKVWDGSSGEVLRVLSGHDGQVQSVAFHPTSGLLASGGWDSTVKVWDARSGEAIQTLRGHKSPVYSVDFSPDGQFLVSAGSNGNIKIWEVATWRVVQSLTGHAGSVLSVAFSPDGRYLAYSGSDSTVRVWDVDAGVERIILRGHTAAVEGVHFSPDGQRLASISPGQAAVKVWDLTRHPEYSTFARTGTGPGPDIEALAFLEGGNRLVSVTAGGKLQTWDADTGVLENELSLPTFARVVSPAVLASLDASAQRLAARAREDARLVKVWDAATGAELFACRGHSLPVTCVRFSPDRRRLATCGCDPDHVDRPHEIRIWDADTGKLQRALKGRGQIFSALFSPDSTWLALGKESGRISLVSCTERAKVVSFAAHKGKVTALAFDPRGRLLASAGQGEGTLKLWRLEVLTEGSGESREAIHTLAAPISLYDLAFSPDGKRLAGISRDLVKLWDVEAGHEVLTLRGAPQRHWDPDFNPRVIFSPDGRRLVGTNWDESISMWEAQDETEEGLAARDQAARRKAAEPRARFWHLQEAEQCLEHKHLSAARFHFQRLGEAPLPTPLQVRRDRLAALLKDSPRLEP